MTASEGRRQLFKLLDAVERGEEVVLERSGVRFRITLDETRQAATAPSSPLVVDDPAVLEGDWSWTVDEDGQLSFTSHGEAP